MNSKIERKIDTQSPTWKIHFPLRGLGITFATAYFLTLLINYSNFEPLLSVWPFSGYRNTAVTSCRPVLPDVFNTKPPAANVPLLVEASRSFRASIQKRLAEGDLESLALAVVTSEGSVFEFTQGSVRANETDEVSRGQVNRHTVYRLASISKMFTVLESLVLRDRGLLSWDDHLTKFFPDFKCEDARSSCQEPITLRQLASHMSGLGLVSPPGVMKDWPHSLDGAGLPPDNGNALPTESEVFDSIRQHPSTAPPYSLPAYSNIGIFLLGQVSLIAGATDNAIGKSTHAELLKRDVFDPLDLSSMSFSSSNYKKGELAVSSIQSENADFDFKGYNLAAGQYSSLADLVKVIQTLLGPERPESLLPPHTVREWFRAIHPMFDEISELGAPWEIVKIRNTWGQTQRLYEKWGQLPGYHTSFAVNPTSGYGVVVLMTGPYPDSQDFTMRAVRHFQPIFDKLLVQATRELYAGKWGWRTEGEGDLSEAIITVKDGTLWIEQLILNGTNTLALLQGTTKTKPFALWSSGRQDEFRMATGIPPFNDAPDHGCLIYMLGFDHGYARGQAIDRLYFSGSGENRTLHFPAADVIMKRL